MASCRLSGREDRRREGAGEGHDCRGAVGREAESGPESPPDGKEPPPTVNELARQLLGSAELRQVGRTAIVNMRSDAEVAMSMQVVTDAVGAFFGPRRG